MTIYIQYPRIKERETSFLLAWELRCFERLVKWYKGDVQTLLCALYRDRWSYETKIHHWLLHDILKKYKNIKFKSINMPLKELLKRYLHVDIEMVYKEWEQNKHICVGDVLSWEIQHLN